MNFDDIKLEEDATDTPESSDENVISAADDLAELSEFESAEIEEETEELEIFTDDRLDSVVESLLFASDRPLSLASLKSTFKEFNVTADQLSESLERISRGCAEQKRGVGLEQTQSGWQFRTKLDNQKYLVRTLKARPFRLSGPALEVLSIVAYKQPLIKNEIDSIRGVESGHLLRALMEKGLVQFGERSELPGKPMFYLTTRKFLEIFGLRNLQELPPLSHIDELMPEGIGEDFQEQKPQTLSDITSAQSMGVESKYSIGEDELQQITEQLTVIQTSTQFFEQEKERQKKERNQSRAQGIREAILMGEEVLEKDRRWLASYDEAQMEGRQLHEEGPGA